ncbi:MAG: Ig-like domain-containing protein, partial [Nanoarchaeota archaeon]
TGTNRSGQWSVSYNVSTLAEERQGVRIIANDTVNNVNNTFVINFTVDRTAPNVIFINPEVVGLSYGHRLLAFNLSILDAFTQVQTALLMFNENTTPFNVTLTNISGNWNTNVNISTLTEGVHNAVAYANDSVGNVNNTVLSSFQVDLSAPNVAFILLANWSNYSTQTQEFRLAITDLITSVQTKLLMFNTNTTPFNATLTSDRSDHIANVDMNSIIEGQHVVTAYANDTVGNVNQTVTLNFNVDRTSPNVTLNFLNNPVDYSNFSIRSSNKTFNASIFDALLQVDTVYFWFDNGTSNDFNITGTNRSGQWSVSYNVSTLAEGKQGVRIIANDTVNNVNNTFVINFTVDFTSPNVTRNFINNPVDNSNFSLSTNNRTFNASIFDALLQIDTVYFWFDNGTGKDFNVTGTNRSGQWSASYNVSTLIEERQEVRIIANDTVNNVNNTFVINFTVDKTAPTVTFLNPTNGSNFSARTQAFNISIFDNVTQVQTALLMFNTNTTPFNKSLTNSSGNWNVNVNLSAFPEGRHTVIAYVND